MSTSSSKFVLSSLLLRKRHPYNRILRYYDEHCYRKGYLVVENSTIRSCHYHGANRKRYLSITTSHGITTISTTTTSEATSAAAAAAATSHAIHENNITTVITNDGNVQQQQEWQQKQRQKEAYEYYRNKNQPYFRLWWSNKRKNKKKNAMPDDNDPQQKNRNTAWYMMAIVIGALGSSYAAVPLYKVFCQTTGYGGTTQRVVLNDNNNNNKSNQTTTDLENNINYVVTTIRTVPDTIRQTISSMIPESWRKQSVISLPTTGTRIHTWTDEDAIAKLASLKPVENTELITIRFDTTVSDTLPWSFTPIQLDVKVVPGETALSFFRVTNHSPNKAITGVATYNVYPPKVGLYFQKIQCFCFEEQRLLPSETVDMPVFFYIDPEILQDPQVSYVKSITLSYTFFQTDEDDNVDDDNDDDNADQNDKKS